MLYLLLLTYLVAVGFNYDIRSNLQLVKFEVLIEKVENLLYFEGFISAIWI